jgi:hypothetical protein
LEIELNRQDAKAAKEFRGNASERQMENGSHGRISPGISAMTNYQFGFLGGLGVLAVPPGFRSS